MGRRGVKKEKKKKGHKMFGLKETVVPQPKKKGWFGSGKLTKPVVGQDANTLMCVLYNQKTLDEIAAMCKPVAGGSEFQVHYRGAQFIVTNPETDTRIAFTIPTCFFNMKQKVSTASVDFSLDEVDEISTSIAPISMEMVKLMADAFPIKYFADQGFQVQVKELEMGSIHRHPGNFGFSATDLDNQVEKPGVIFRNRVCTDQLQVDSVMYIPGDRVEIVTTETRGVTVRTSGDGGIEGQYLESPTIHYIIQDSTTSKGFQDFFGEEKRTTSNHTFTIKQKWIQEKYPDIQKILETFLDTYEYEPKLFVDPSLIEQEHSYYRTYGAKNYQKPNYGNNWNEDEDDDYFDTFYKKPKGTTVVHDPVTATIPVNAGATPEERRCLNRATWRKTQTTSLLRSKKVNLLDFPDIDGGASDKDIISIVQALKGIQYTDIDIRNFFTGCGYPPESVGIYYNNLAEKAKPAKLDIGDKPSINQ